MASELEQAAHEYRQRLLIERQARAGVFQLGVTYGIFPVWCARRDTGNARGKLVEAALAASLPACPTPLDHAALSVRTADPRRNGGQILRLWKVAEVEPMPPTPTPIEPRKFSWL